MKKLLSRFNEIFAPLLAKFIRMGEKSPAPEEAPTRSPSELKILAETLKGTLQNNPKDMKALYKRDLCISIGLRDKL
jgi:hypothetical protein